MVLQQGEVSGSGLVLALVESPALGCCGASLRGGEQGWQCCQLSHALGKSLHMSKSNVYSLEIVDV